MNRNHFDKLLSTGTPETVYHFKPDDDYVNSATLKNFIFKSDNGLTTEFRADIDVAS